jgi:hypothetical protein
MEKKIVAFLDIPGFKNIAENDFSAAVELLRNYQSILDAFITDKALHPPESYKSKAQGQLARAISIDTFEYLLPYSDSLVIVGNNPDIFVQQLSHFILSCYQFTSLHFTNVYEPEGGKKNAETMLKENIHLHPTLFRGGLSFGDVYVPDVSAIKDSKLVKREIVVGLAYIESVSIESIGKGPRIFCKKHFVDLLAPNIKDLYMLKTEREDVFELLWPISRCILSNGYDQEISEFHELFESALNLWSGYIGQKCEEHYFKFIFLITKACLSFGNYYGRLNDSRDFISRIIGSIIGSSKLSQVLDSPTIPLILC